MRALTLWQPWASAIFMAGKDIENRTWPFYEGFRHRRIAIHAGKKVDSEAVKMLRESGLWPAMPPLSALPRGAVIGSVVLLRAVKIEWYPEGTTSPWASGPWCWELGDLERLTEPIPCRGVQGLWAIPQEIEKLMREQQQKALE